MPKGCNFIAPQALLNQQLYYENFILLLKYRAIYDTSSERSVADELNECIKNFSRVNLNNKVLIRKMQVYKLLQSKFKINILKKNCFPSAGFFEAVQLKKNCTKVEF